VWSLGIEVGEVKLNLEKMMKSKDKAVTILTKGVEFLLKKNKVTYYKGTGSFNSKNEIIIKDDQNKETIIEAEKTVIATGSVAVSLPGIEIDEKVIVSSTGALKLDKVPKKMVVESSKKNGCCWWWLHRIRNGLCLVKIRSRSASSRIFRSYYSRHG